ncbi:hypothetical protein P3T23_001310, partial [Paraburkholderia sp. GAS448]|uniref:hypothetical protein n=1 Tax=Paraburkholderia sp. GAS448 TaxID=3035136 RepID=UPI003D243E92
PSPVLTGPEEPASAPPSSAHTYRLLIFKDRSASRAAPVRPPSGTAPPCVAASAAEKRDYVATLSLRQQHFLLSLKT